MKEEVDENVFHIELSIGNETTHCFTIGLYEEEPTFHIRIIHDDNGVLNGCIELKTSDKAWDGDELFSSIVIKSPMNTRLHEKVATIVAISLNQLYKATILDEDKLDAIRKRFEEALVKYYNRRWRKGILKPAVIEVDDFNPYKAISAERPANSGPMKRVYSEEEEDHFAECLNINVVVEVFDSEAPVKRFETQVPFRNHHVDPVLKVYVFSVVNDEISGLVEAKTSKEVSYRNIYERHSKNTVMRQIRIAFKLAMRKIERYQPGLIKEARQCYKHIIRELKSIDLKKHGSSWS